MSATVKFIPADHTFAPNYLEAKKGVELLQGLYPNLAKEGFSNAVYPDPCYIDNGGSMENIHCPHCGEYVSQSWWSDAFGEAYREDFWKLEVTMPCCGKGASLNELTYKPHVGFSRFVLQVSELDGCSPEEAAKALAALYKQPFFSVVLRG